MNARSWSTAVVVAFLGIGIGAAQSAEPGRWVRQDIQFNYMPLTTTYSCTGLAQKLRALLNIAGAREDMQITTSGCSRGEGVPDHFARARLIFYALHPAGADESAANVQSADAAAAEGAWKTVQLGFGPRTGLELGDCELVEQFRHSVLPDAFAVRAIREPAPCAPFQRSAGAFNLKFDVFSAAKR